ncbi:MAG: DUF4397 domain-containing protein [Bacteroidetes bacterium]|nr:DUF4397 domain-containing protein [Bacteroidota bacterium]
MVTEQNTVPSDASAPHRGTLRGMVLRTLTAAFIAIAGAAFLSSCSPDDPFVPHRPPDTVVHKSGAFLRVINAAAGSPKVDVKVDDDLFFPSPQGYLDFSETNNNARYYPADSNAHRIRFLSGSTVLATDTLIFAKGGYYTAYFHGNAARGYHVLVTTDTIAVPTIPGKSMKYRVVNLSPDAPPLDMRQDDNTSPFVVTALAYGSASQYIPSKEYFPKGTGLWIYDHTSGAEIRAITPPYIVLPPNSTFTLVLTGNGAPHGDEAFLNFSAFQESYLGADSLHGSSPININFAAARFANITASGDSLLDVTFYDPSQEFCENDNFRRNLIGQPQTVEGIASLGLDGQPVARSYFYISLLLRQDFPFRVEYHQPYRTGHSCTTGTVSIDYRKQDVLVPRAAFTPTINKRYTIVAYGPYDSLAAHSALLLDNTSAPPSGMAQIRFFNGGFGSTFNGKKLRLRINGAATPIAMGYGEIPEGTNSFAAPAGAVSADVIDEQGNVLLTQVLDKTPLEANKSYTVFLSRGSHGDKVGYLHALAEDLNP